MADQKQRITTLLFDCDNTLVLSEEKAFEACAELANEILESKGKPERYTGAQLMADFVGQNFRGMITNLKNIYKYEMDDATLDSYVQRELTAVIRSLKGNPDESGKPTKEIVQPCEGVDAELKKLADAKKPDGSSKYLMSVVSSSAYPRVYVSVDLTNQLQYFEDPKPKDAPKADPNSLPKEESRVRVFSAATSMRKPLSKPDPAVYIHAMQRLGFITAKKSDIGLVEPGSEEQYDQEWAKYSLDPKECVAVEDSKSGATAAVAAGIPTIGYTGSYPEEEVEEKTKILLDAGVAVMMKHWSEFEKCLAEVEAGAQNTKPAKK
ncbi:HAD-like protein [Glarea lozoyensis ATCC 20868]|uniref:HAD-like protein n=1 Tax=Glarea lozoyensis (strain ATCC 20868 / MF5171) TaxID=1116229 RepID=S3DUP5_GLAL2|nr:HAD-like protein [Glarea lozoyensis ATCC 20868]EPE30148.1 HAD-like protein [Glarea lozoyensis ATCC 20868]